MGAETAYNKYSPLHLVLIWTYPTTTKKCVSAAVLLPSEVATGDYSIRVHERRRELEVHVKWPLLLYNVEMLYRKWLQLEENRFESYHRKLLGFKNALKVYREKRADSVESVARIAFAFAVETHTVRRSSLEWVEHAARMICIDMKAYEKTCCVK